MKVLFLSPYPPYPPNFGGSTRIFNLMRQTARNHEVISLSYPSTAPEPNDMAGLEAVARRIEYVDRPAIDKRIGQARSLLSSRSFQKMSHYSPAMQNKIESIAADEGVDVIVAEFSQMGYFDFPDGVTLVIDEHNIESDLIHRSYKSAPPSFRKLYNFIESRKFRREELALLEKAHRVTVTSERDRELLIEANGALEIDVIPNGVDTEFFKPRAGGAEGSTLVFTGAMHYHPNTQAAVYFLDEILPLVERDIPDVRFVAAGGNVPDELARYASDRVRFTGYVDDIRDYIDAAAVFVVPLLVGGGTRFKVVEAMASGKPVVSTSLGAEGIPVTPGTNILLADDPNSFAQAVITLLANRPAADELARAGRSFVEEYFSWNIIGARFEKTLRAAVVKEVTI